MSYMYTSNVGYSADVNAAIGKFDRPIKIIIEEESNLCREQGQFDKLIYNVASSDRFAEAYFLENELGILSAVEEGGEGAELSSKEIAKHYVEHTEFKGDCVINKTLIEDSNRNEIAKRVRKLVRSYWLTRYEFAQQALYKGLAPSMSFAGKSFDLTTPDGKSLFNKAHTYGTGEGAGVQSNNFYYSGDATVDSDLIAELISAMAVMGRQMRSENGTPLGYTFNKIYIPGNRFALENAVRRAIGTQYRPGVSDNDINVIAGGWQLIVLPLWESDVDRFIIQSDESNRYNGGSMFYDRTPFQITRNDNFDRNDNVLLHGRARMSIVHNSYKHLMMCSLVGTSGAAYDAATSNDPNTVGAATKLDI
ncbi:MAG: hypothetical protein IJY04_04605 [Clostridia bacterium]|nr:hypothetical protein [Clostridia bacterium]